MSCFYHQFHPRVLVVSKNTHILRARPLSLARASLFLVLLFLVN